MDLFGGLGGEAVEGAKDDKDLASVIRNYNPLSSLWWSRAAYNRLVADNLQRALDPEAEEAFERRRSRAGRFSGRLFADQGGGPARPSRTRRRQRHPDAARHLGRQSD